MPATLSAGIDSLSLKISTPMESDGVTPRDDLIGVKVWYSTTANFTPPGVGTLAYDGTGLDISITGLTSGSTYYVRYALISEIEPDFYTLSSQLTGTPVFETQTVDTTPPPTPTGVSVTAGVGTVFISHDNPTYTAGRGHRRTHVFALKTTAANTAAGYTFARAAAAGTIGQFTGNSWSFSSDPDTEWHIWLKWETNNGILSAVASGGNTGDTAKTSQDVSTLLSALTGKITTGQLATALNSNLTNLNSQYVIKVGAAGQVAGFGIASTATDSGNATSEFGIQADKFWIAPPAVAQASAPSTNLYRGFVWIDTSVPATPVTKYWTGAAWSTTRQTVLPFAVVTTPETIGGQTVNPGVYIDAAYIKDGTITNAKIGDATISAAKIGSVDATKITVNQLTASQINSNGLTIRDTAGNILLDASNSQLGVSLFVGTGSNKRLLSTVGAFASTPNTAYIGEFSSAPAFSADRTITSWSRVNGITTVATSGGAHGFVLGSKVTIAGANATVNGTYEIIEIPTTTTFKIVNAGTDATAGTAGTASGYLYAENSVYKNTTNGNSYILTGSTLAWSLFLEKGVKGTDGVNGITAILSNESHVFPATNAGAVSSYANSGTTIRVYEGATELTYSTANPTPNSSWKVTASASNITAGTIAAVANTLYAEMPALSAGVANGTDTSTITYTITGKNAIGTAFTITKTQTFSKSKQGDKPVAGTDYTVTNGTSPLIYDIVTSSPVLTKQSSSAAASGTYSSITVQGKKYDGNVTSNYGWVTITGNGDTEATTATDTATSAASLAPAATAGKSSYTIKMYNQASVAGATLLDTQTVSVVFKGDKPVAGTDYTVTNGTRGSTWAYISGRTSWSDTVANTYFTDNFGGTKVVNDTVTQYGTNFSQTRVWTGSEWSQVTVAIDGTLLVKGTVAADSIASGTISVGVKIQSTDGNMVMDFINKTISITI